MPTHGTDIDSHAIHLNNIMSDELVHFSFVHINDLYELLPSGGEGGVARLATLRNNIQQSNPPNDPTITMLAGDLFSPSALSTVPVNGKPLNGKQMVDVMNVMGLNMSTLGNHETDVEAADFKARLTESQFPWLCANANNMDYPNLIESLVIEHEGVKVGIFGLTLDSNNKVYQSYTNFSVALELAAKKVKQFQDDGVDVIIALTHLPMTHDQVLAASVPGIDLIMGGHEHTAMINQTRGFPSVFKADSNVRSAWIHDLYFNVSAPRSDRSFNFFSGLVAIDDQLPDDPVVGQAVSRWVDEAFAGFEKAGFHPDQPLAYLTEPLIGNNEIIFNQRTLLTDLFNLALLEECYKYEKPDFHVPQIEATLFNAGAIRIDDTIPADTHIIEYDAIRTSPYLNSGAIANITGALLKRTLDTSQAYLSNSQTLHSYPNITKGDAGSAAGEWLINGKALDVNRWYVVGLLQYLLRGKDPYDFLNPMGPSSNQLKVLAQDEGDVRRSLIDQIRQYFAPTPTPDPDPEPKPSEKILGLPKWAFIVVAALIVLVVGFIAYRIMRWARRRRMEHKALDEGLAYSEWDDVERHNGGGGIKGQPHTNNVMTAQERRDLDLLQQRYSANSLYEDQA